MIMIIVFYFTCSGSMNRRIVFKYISKSQKIENNIKIYNHEKLKRYNIM